jgi:hypothetical protein
MASSNSDRPLGKSSSNSSSNSSSGGARGAGKTPMQSQKLTRTIEELESAFSDWESLSSTKSRAAKVEEDRRKSKAAGQSANQSEKEFRKKTKKLLKELREQLAELND